MQVLDRNSQACTAWVEHQVLNHVKDALRVTVNWKVPSIGVPQKLSSLRFVLQSFQRHLHRVMDLEECDGYMEFVAESKPNLQPRIERLQQDHGQFREELSRLLPHVAELSDYQADELEKICEEISELLEHVDRHDSEEIDLLQESTLLDEGGEG